MAALHSLIGKWHESVETVREYPDVARFRRFYEALPDKKDVFYVFFTSGMLMWLRKCLRFVPPETNVVLVGAGLSPGERSWVERRAGRPAFVTGSRIDDKSCWRWLFDVNRHHFGWLDVDCFVMQPALFQEMAAIAAQDAFNTVWSYEAHTGIRVLNTFFLFVNADVIREIGKRGLRVSPVTYSVRPSQRGRHARGAWSRVITRGQADVLSRVWPCDVDGTLQLPYDGYWDTLKVYQLIAQHHGFGARKVRDLHGLLLSPRSYSPEVVHIGMASHLTRASRDRVLLPVYALHLQFRFALLREALDDLPAAYHRVHADWREEMRELGLAEDRIGANVRRFFKTMGLGEDVLCGEHWRFLDAATT